MRTSAFGSSAEFRAQMVVEVMVNNLQRSLSFYRSLGFSVERCVPPFASLRWGDSYIFLDEKRTVEPGSDMPRANVRVIVEDVDRVRRLVHDLHLPVVSEIGDRPYGLRDFVIADPDGFGIRFAQVITVRVVTAE